MLTVGCSRSYFVGSRSLVGHGLGCVRLTDKKCAVSVLGGNVQSDLW